MALGKEALFSFSYNGITEDEAVTLAEKFDWKTIQAAAQNKIAVGLCTASIAGS